MHLLNMVLLIQKAICPLCRAAAACAGNLDTPRTHAGSLVLVSGFFTAALGGGGGGHLALCARRHTQMVVKVSGRKTARKCNLLRAYVARKVPLLTEARVDSSLPIAKGGARNRRP